MLPELARRIVVEYSVPGALVVDPFAGIGTTIAEAALLDRRAVGVELEDRWVALAEENLDHIAGRWATRPEAGRRASAVPFRQELAAGRSEGGVRARELAFRGGPGR